MSDEVDFGLADKDKNFLEIETIILMGRIKHFRSSQNSKFAKSLQCQVRDEVDFLSTNQYASILQVDFNTLGFKILCRMTLSLLIDMIKHSQSTQSNKSAISLQYLKKEVRDGVHFLHADKHQSWHYRF